MTVQVQKSNQFYLKSEEEIWWPNKLNLQFLIKGIFRVCFSKNNMSLRFTMQMDSVFKSDQAHNLYIQPSSYHHVIPYYSSNPVTPFPQPFQPNLSMLIISFLQGLPLSPQSEDRAMSRRTEPGHLGICLPCSQCLQNQGKLLSSVNLEAVTVPANSYEDEADNYCEI